MHLYHVVEHRADSGLYALQCNSGRYHVARALNVMPPLDAALNGYKPQLGFGILVCARSGAIFRLIFESINDTELVPHYSRMPRELPPSIRLSSTSAM